MMRSMGGVTQIIPADRVASRRRMPESLMMSAAQLGLTAQDVADLVAFLRSNWIQPRGGAFSCVTSQSAMSVASVGCTPNRSVP